MKRTVKIIVNTVQIISFCGVMLTGVLGAIYEILGNGKFEQMLSVIGLPNGFEWTWVIGAIMLLLLILTYIIKGKLLYRCL